MTTRSCEEKWFPIYIQSLFGYHGLNQNNLLINPNDPEGMEPLKVLPRKKSPMSFSIAPMVDGSEPDNLGLNSRTTPPKSVSKPNSSGRVPSKLLLSGAGRKHVD
jgi:hypothetical protein